MRKKIILLFFVFQLASVIAQEHKIVAKQIEMLQTDIDVFVGFDGMGNIYYIKNNIFYKKNKQELWQYKTSHWEKLQKLTSKIN